MNIYERAESFIDAIELTHRDANIVEVRIADGGHGKITEDGLIIVPE